MKKLKRIMLFFIGILLFSSNFIYADGKKYQYSGQTLKCFKKYNGDFKTVNDDFNVKFEIINIHEAKIILAYKGHKRFLVEAENIVGQIKEININISDGEKELLKLENLLFDDNNLANNDFKKFIVNPQKSSEFLNGIEIKINTDENLYDKFNKKIKNLNVELQFRFKGNLENSWEGNEKYWAIISTSSIPKLNLGYLKKRYIDGNPYFTKMED